MALSKKVLSQLAYAGYMGISSASLCVFSFQLFHLPVMYFSVCNVAVSTSIVYILYWRWVDEIKNKDGLRLLSGWVGVIRSPKLILSLVLIGISLFYVTSFFWLISIGIFVLIYFHLQYFPNSVINAKKKAVFKTTLLSIIWGLATTVLPLSHSLTSSSLLLLFFHRLFFLLPLCILFDQKDRKNDLGAGRHTLATVCSEKTLMIHMLIFLFLFLLISLEIDFILKVPLLSLLLPNLLLILTMMMMFLYKPSKRWIFLVAVDGMMIYFPLLSYLSAL